MVPADFDCRQIIAIENHGAIGNASVFWLVYVDLAGLPALGGNKRVGMGKKAGVCGQIKTKEDQQRSSHALQGENKFLINLIFKQLYRIKSSI